MIPSTTSYGMMLYRFMVDLKQEATVYQYLLNLSAILSDDEIHRFMDSHLIESSQKQHILNQLFDQLDIQLSSFKDLMTFIMMLNDYKYSSFKTLVTVYEKQYHQDNGIKVAEIASATPLNHDQLDEIEHHLQQRYQSKIELRLSVNPELLSGLVIRVESEKIDLSLSNQLERLKEQLQKGVRDHV